MKIGLGIFRRRKEEKKKELSEDDKFARQKHPGARLSYVDRITGRPIYYCFDCDVHFEIPRIDERRRKVYEKKEKIVA